MVLKKLSQHESALTDFNKAIEINPIYLDALINRGITHVQMGNFEEALDDFNKGLEVTPDSFEALNNRGNVFKELYRYTEALADYDRAIAIQPDYIDALNNRGVVYQELRQFEKALESFNKVLVLKPSDHEALNNRGVIYKELNLYEKALEDYGAAIAIKPDYAEAYNNRGIALKDLGQFEKAIEDYNKAIFLKPHYAEPYFNKSLQFLLLGDFKSAWPLYEWRWKTNQNTGEKIKTSLPVWRGETGKRLLLWAEQGIGDEIMYASMIAEVGKICKTLTVKCDKRLIPLFERSFSKKINFLFDQSLINESDYDCHIAIASLPSILRPSSESFGKASKPYLRYENKKAEELKEKILADKAEKLIGISWNSASAIPGAHYRNVTLNDLAKHLDMPGIKLVNLQYGEVADEIEQLSSHQGIEIKKVPDIDNRNDIDGLAALIGACDQVVTIDNATAHLAGALGARTNVLLPFNQNWQWGTTGSESYWYNSVKLYRQKSLGDWSKPLNALKADIKR